MASSEDPKLISLTTIWSLISTVVILAAGYTASRKLLPASASNKTRFLFIWHATDALIHFILEGGYLYNCFFSSSSLIDAGITASEYLPPNVFFLGDQENVYGASYGTSPMSALWREYARADKRWGGSDLTVISLELLTVLVAGPMAAWICYCIKNKRPDTSFWMIVLATGELYGGFMTFCPEWLSGSPNLDTSNWMFTWLYLFFFNTLWVWIPLWILWDSYGSFVAAVNGQEKVDSARKTA